MWSRHFINLAAGKRESLMFARIKGRAAALVAAVVAVVVSLPAHAALTATDLDAIEASVTADMGILLPFALGLVGIVTVASIAIGLVRSFSKKGARG